MIIASSYELFHPTQQQFFNELRNTFRNYHITVNHVYSTNKLIIFQHKSDQSIGDFVRQSHVATSWFHKKSQPQKKIRVSVYHTSEGIRSLHSANLLSSMLLLQIRLVHPNCVIRKWEIFCFTAPKQCYLQNHDLQFRVSFAYNLNKCNLRPKRIFFFLIHPWEPDFQLSPCLFYFHKIQVLSNYARVS